jgi:SAM-dependent methyltransferase
MTATSATAHEQDVAAAAQRLLDAALGATDLLAVFLGDRLGWYVDLRDHGASTPQELASRTATSERYAREWLEQQAVTGLLAAEDDDGERRYRLPAAAAEVLTDQHSLSYVGPLARMLAASAMQLPALLEAYRTGGGLPWAQLGDHARESQADMNRPWYEQALAPALAGLDQLHPRLSRPGARIADVGCGAGWSTIALARAYPDAVVEGFDVDAPSVALARDNATASGLADRVRFTVVDGAALPADGLDAVFLFECLHDMPRPVDVLTTARRALADEGTVVVMDEAVAERFTAPGDELERLMYGFSLLVCLPDGMAHPPSAATGTVLRPEVLERYARNAGFARVDVLPVEDFGFWRFHELVP